MIPQATGRQDRVTPHFTFQCVRAGADVEEMKKIYALRYEVYCLECGFLSPDQFRNGLESDDYDAHSAHFVARNIGNEVVGSLRLVQPAE